MVLNIIQIQLGSEELRPTPNFWVHMLCDLDLSDMTLGHSHETVLWVIDNCVEYYQDPTWQ